MSMENPMTPSGIETATFRFVVQYLDHCATISGQAIDSDAPEANPVFRLHNMTDILCLAYTLAVSSHNALTIIIYYYF
jgi:hypothetical protein